MYKLYEYVEPIVDDREGTIEPTTMKYIADANGNVHYTNLNNMGWEAVEYVTLSLISVNLTFNGDMSKKEVEEMVFLDVI